jgi:predicted ArsR family transcriptional regulator
VQSILRDGRSPLRRNEKLLALFREHHNLTRAEVMKLMGISANTATRYLKGLRADGSIVRIEPTRGPGTHFFQLKEEHGSPAAG